MARTAGPQRKTLQRVVSLPLELGVFAISSLVTLAGFVIAGFALWQAVLFAPLVGTIAVTATVVYGSIAGSQRRTLAGSRRHLVIAHMVLGLLVLLVADVLTMLFYAEGLLTTALAIIVVGGLWIEGLALCVAGVLVFRGATRGLRAVAIVGLGTTVVWSLWAVVILGTFALRLVGDGFGGGIVYGRDAVEYVALVVIFVVVPGLIFRRDLRTNRTESSMTGDTETYGANGSPPLQEEPNR